MPPINNKEIEKHWRSYWEKHKIFKFNPNDKSIFSIDTPPPTLSGKMHIGHAFSYAQEDFIARFKRMSGFEVFYPFGTDDNGLPTERLIEKLKNVKSKSMSRTDFITLCLNTLKEITPEFIQDWKNLAISCDYDIYYSTIDENSRKISQKSFIDLYKTNQVYKKEFPTLFCPDCQTPIAQAELEDKEFSSQFTTLKFTSNTKTLPIATTRPELLPACVAVFINPGDKRYSKFINKKAKVPLFNQEVPILPDESADIDKGTGVLMVCSYGDKYDVDAINRHKLTPKIVLNKQGRLTQQPYSNQSIKEARKKILQDLKDQDLIIEQKPIQHSVNVHDKCGTEIEFLPVEQWFIKILDKKPQLINQGKKINWHPKFMQKRYENWIHGLDWDWSISRERHFGIPIPAWYCPECKITILADEKELPVDPMQTIKNCPDCLSQLKPEDKVLDTWATSSLTPQIAASLTSGVQIPYNLRPQAHDIIRTWAFYTIVKSLLHENKIPWQDITISGFVTLEGQKMSKSKGKAIHPQEVMEKYGADSLRYWASTSKLGEDLDYQEKDLVTGKKFITKIANAANFVFMNIKPVKAQPFLETTDRLFLQQLNSLIQEATESFNEYNYSKAKSLADSFFWKTFADNYLEIIKYRVYNGSEKEKASASYTLYQSLLTILKLMAPITPYITEEIYQKHFKKQEKAKSIHITDWPKPFNIKTAKEDNKTWQTLIQTISKVRQEKAIAKKSVKAEISLKLPKQDLQILKPVIKDFQAVTNAKSINPGNFKMDFL